jgi:hypothetical protein
VAAELSDRVDPLAVGADLPVWPGLCGRGQKMVLAPKARASIVP